MVQVDELTSKKGELRVMEETTTGSFLPQSSGLKIFPSDIKKKESKEKIKLKKKTEPFIECNFRKLKGTCKVAKIEAMVKQTKER